MSYNKLKALAANVEAIETAMKIRVQGRQATAQEKEILSLYSGFGGIKEVLNIGTDKPVGGDMEEPIQRLQELIDAYPHFTEPMRHNVMESIKASVLTAFYTPNWRVCCHRQGNYRGKKSLRRSNRGKNRRYIAISSSTRAFTPA